MNSAISGARMKPAARLLPAALFSTLASPTNGFAQTKVPDLTHVSIEDLMNIEITSASRKEQRGARLLLRWTF